MNVVGETVRPIIVEMPDGRTFEPDVIDDGTDFVTYIDRESGYVYKELKDSTGNWMLGNMPEGDDRLEALHIRAASLQTLLNNIRDNSDNGFVETEVLVHPSRHTLVMKQPIIPGVSPLAVMDWYADKYIAFDMDPSDIDEHIQARERLNAGIAAAAVAFTTQLRQTIIETGRSLLQNGTPDEKQLIRSYRIVRPGGPDLHQENIHVLNPEEVPEEEPQFQAFDL